VTIDPHRITEDGKVIQGCSHTSLLLNHKARKKLVIQTVINLRRLNLPFDSIVCSGISGMLVAPQVCELLDKHLVIIRKENESRYSDFIIEGVSPSRFIILDDLICSGNTIKYITSTLQEENPLAVCLGAYFYMADEHPYTWGEKHFRSIHKIPLLNT
jgi:adenine/guanine phosphoribosyltransferase-like PRPP-binding protein